MNRLAWHMFLTVGALTGLFTSSISAYCSKCVKIESEREKEKTAHPKTWEYYDEAKEKVEDHQKPQEGSIAGIP